MLAELYDTRRGIGYPTLVGCGEGGGFRIVGFRILEFDGCETCRARGVMGDGQVGTPILRGVMGAGQVGTPILRGMMGDGQVGTPILRGMMGKHVCE